MMLRVGTLLIASLIARPAFAQPSKMDSEMKAIRTYCKPDVARLCPKVEPGGGRIKTCLMEHKNEMSVGCARALQGIKKDH